MSDNFNDKDMYNDEFYEEIRKINREAEGESSEGTEGINVTCRGCDHVNTYYPSPFTHTPPHLECDGCDKSISYSGQVLAYPYGQGEDYAGERYDDDY